MELMKIIYVMSGIAIIIVIILFIISYSAYRIKNKNSVKIYDVKDTIKDVLEDTAKATSSIKTDKISDVVSNPNIRTIKSIKTKPDLITVKKKKKKYHRMHVTSYERIHDLSTTNKDSNQELKKFTSEDILNYYDEPKTNKKQKR